jgi:hypothetical protein
MGMVVSEVGRESFERWSDCIERCATHDGITTAKRVPYPQGIRFPMEQIPATPLRDSRNSMKSGVLMSTGRCTQEMHMANNDHNKAAELHENAAKSHRAAAEQHSKGDHAKGMEHSKSAQQHSQSAGKQSDQAHAKSQQQK